MTLRDSRILCIFAHPDDESYIVGGTLARAVSEGAEVTVISVTKGDKGFQHIKDPSEKERLTNIREEEMKNAARVLGVKEVILWDYPDGGLDSLGNKEQELVNELINLINRIKPTLILTFGPDGVSGHRDHIAIGKIVCRLSTFGLDGLSTPLYGVTVPRELTSYLQKLLFSRLKTKRHYNTNHHLYAPPLAHVKQVDISAFIEKKIAAMRMHVSQNPEGLIRASRLLPKKFWHHEYFIPLLP